MRTLKIVALASTCLLLGAAVTEAADMYTPPVFIDNEFVNCQITNITGQTRSFQFEIINSSGVVVASGGNTLGPGQSGFGGASSPSITGLLYCHFIETGQKTNYRAAITIRTEGLGRDLLALPAD
jgi:hypothetical protein